ncbi:hypothetical protein ASG68_14560 [Rhizobium sp. Leaf453]|nr:hypothetical protein ASG42_19750 [Rhizobium sp. Leaf391]KQT07088.1 hypothetical protein ASG50_01295 [Rhizobium sp. Leaf386]KQT95214.1 hypothetical protein ASG68_14560 [Rhizobium sp. Leaf453]
MTILLLGVGLAACSTTRPRAPSSRDESVDLIIGWDETVHTTGSLTVTQQATTFEFTKPGGSRCSASLPGKTTVGTAICADGTAAKVKVFWRGGNYTGEVDTGDRPVAPVIRSLAPANDFAFPAVDRQGKPMGMVTLTSKRLRRNISAK